MRRFHELTQCCWLLLSVSLVAETAPVAPRGGGPEPAFPAYLGSPLSHIAAGTALTRFRLASEQFGLDCAAARRVGLDGIEIGVDGPAPKPANADPAVRRRYQESVNAAGLAVSSLVMHFLCDYPLHSEPDAPAWLEQAIDAISRMDCFGDRLSHEKSRSRLPAQRSVCAQTDDLITP
jgi:hypothetical protein